MACNCGATKEIEALYRTYGSKTDNNTKKTLWFRIKESLINIGVYLAMIPVSVVLVYYVINKAIHGEDKISVSKFFNRK